MILGAFILLFAMSDAGVARGAPANDAALRALAADVARYASRCIQGVASPGPGADRVVTRIRLRFDPDGTLSERSAIVEQAGVDDENRRFAARVGEAAVVSLSRCGAATFPAELYASGWREIIINTRLPG